MNLNETHLSYIVSFSHGYIPLQMLLFIASLFEHVWRKKHGISDTHWTHWNHGEVQLWSGQVQLRSIELDVGPPKSRQQNAQRKGSPDRGQLSKQLSKTRVHGEICELEESYGKNRCQSWSWDIFRIVPLWFGLVALRSLLFVLASQVQPLRGSRDFGSTKPKNHFS